MAEDKMFHLEIVSPDRVFYENRIEMLELKTTEGDIGILRGHIPLTAMLAPGIAHIHTGSEVFEAAIHDGFLEIMPDKVLVLAESCEWPDEIDINRAEEARIRAERLLKSSDVNVNINRAELALRKSLIRLELADKMKG